MMESFAVLVLAAIVSSGAGQNEAGVPGSLAELGELASNTSALIGANASFYCEVIGELSFGQSLQFDKIQDDGDSIFIFGSDKNPDFEVSDPVKYEVTDKYRLHVKDITWEDEGTYRCKLDAVDVSPHQASLTVVDPPETMRMFWPGDRDWTEQGVKANLTCKASRSRPPATMTWLRSTTDVTGVVSHVDVPLDQYGYGEGTSYLEFTPSAGEEGIIYTCKVNVPGMPAHLIKQLIVTYSGSGTILASCVLLATALLASVM